MELWQVDGALAGLRARETELRGRREHLLSLLRADRARFAGQAMREGVASTPHGGADGREAPEGPAGGTPMPSEAGTARLPGSTAFPGPEGSAPLPGPAGAGALSGPAGAAGHRGFPGAAGHPGFPGAAGVAGADGAGGRMGGGTAGGASGAGRGEVSRRTAQNVLLVLGGLMLAVAAIVFTVVSWGHLGIGGRAAILAGLTGVTLAVPALLLRRGLNATAETIGVLGLALMLLDGYAARRVGLAGALDGWDYTAATLVVVAAAAAIYGRVSPLKVPMPLAVVLVQAPLPLLSVGEGHGWPSAALAATAAVDAAIWTLASRARGVRVTATVCLAATWTIALLWAGLASFTFDGAWHAGALVALAVVGGYVAFRSADETGRNVAAAGSATALVAAAGAFVFGLLPEDWRVVPYTVAALAVTALAGRLPVRLRTPYAYAGAGLALASGVAVVPQALIAMLDAPVLAEEFWTDGTLVMLRAAPVVLALLATLPLIMGRARWAVAVFAVAAALVAPVAYGLPYTVTVGVLLAVALGCTLAVVRFGAAPWAWPAGVSGGFAVLWALDQRPVAYAVLGALLVAWGALYRRPAALVGASLAGAGLVWVALDGLGVFARDAAATGIAAGAALALLGWYGTRAPGMAGSASGMAGSASGMAGSASGTAGSASGTAGNVAGMAGSASGAAGSGSGVGGSGFGGSWAAAAGRVTATVMAVVALLVEGDVLVGTLRAYLGAFMTWSGAPAFTGSRPLALVVLGVAGAALALATRPAFAVAAGAVVVAAVPVAVRLPYPVVLVMLVVAAALAAGTAAAGRGGAVTRWASTGAALWLGSLALGWALAVETATLAVLPALAAVAALTGLLWAARPEPAIGGSPGAEAGAHAPGEERLGGPGVGSGTGAARFGGPGVGSGTGAARFGGPGVGSGAGAAREARFRWMALAGVLVACEVVAVAASYGVRAVEAYTLPFAVLLLAAGWWRARGKELSSWPVYAPGLALAFGPSLVQEATPLRALLLGAAALVVTLAGARWRLQAPTVMGGVTVAIVAVRELAPWIADLFGVVPRWVPMALGGLLLVVVGATYEARKRDMRRLRDAVARLR